MAVPRSPSPAASSSPLSSLGSLSPTPPDWYPSPSSSQEPSDPGVLPCEQDRSPEDGPPPAKKRKIPERKPRTTQYLDLSAPLLEQNGCLQSPPLDQRVQLDQLLKVLRKRRKIVVIAGAGISVSAGIPDFRSSRGLFKSLRGKHKLKGSGKHLFDASVYKTDASTASFHEMVRDLSHLVSTSQPTLFHHLLATLAQEGRLLRLYSQNVDGIDTSLTPLATNVPLPPRAPWPRTIQLHGGLEKMVCTKCHKLSDFVPALFEGPEPPSCSDCEQLDSVRTNIAGKRSHGIGKLRPRILLYNEYNPDEDAIGAVTKADLKSRPDAVIVAGTSLKVPGVKRIVKEMCGVVRGRRDGVAIWINNDPEPVGKVFENCWDLIVRGNCDEVARRANMRKWDDTSLDEFHVVEDGELELAKEKGIPEVVVETPRKIKGAKQFQGVWTPIGSPYYSTLGASGSEVKSASTPTKGKRKAPLENADTLGAKRPRKPSKKKPPKEKAVSKGVAKINMAFKVTKSSLETATSKSKLVLASELPTTAMSNQRDVSTPDSQPPPPSPSSSLPSLPEPAVSERPLPGTIPCHEPLVLKLEDTASSPPLPWRDDTISPTGRVPENLAMLLN
ncbi:MAG: hypothetical protein M1833_007179 [Piccolia ochrophora]|nr:MAG: hypothetical protein M1833_007179 [Piccolia ochrophora]